MAGKELKIVVSNDDGVEAQGLNTLVEMVSQWAECRVVAPAEPKSGAGHAIHAILRTIGIFIYSEAAADAISTRPKLQRNEALPDQACSALRFKRAACSGNRLPLVNSDRITDEDAGLPAPTRPAGLARNMLYD